MDRHNPTDLAAEAQRKSEAAERNRLAAIEEAEDMTWLMNDKRGRRVVWQLLEKTGVFRSSFRLNNEMAFLEGQRNIGLIYLHVITTAAPEQYMTMIKEQKK